MKVRRQSDAFLRNTRKRAREARVEIEARRRALGERSAPIRASAERTVAAASSRLQPILQPIASGFGTVAPFVASVPLAIASAGVWVISSIATGLQRTHTVMTLRIGPAVKQGIARSDRALTPIRTGALASLVAGGLLVGSQFLDYRGVAVGAPLYKGQIAVDAPAPVTATAVAGTAHYWVMIPIALVAALAAAGSLRRDDRRPGIALMALGAVVVVVALTVDLPQALDPVHALPYSDASPRLLGGFWAELLAGISLLIAGTVVVRRDRGGDRRRRVKSARERTDLATIGAG